MVTITVKNIPKELHEKLCERAEINCRSLNKEIIASLESTMKPRKIDPVAYLDYIRQARRRANLNVTIDDISAAIDEGVNDCR